jgi:hypothetical protein
MDIIARFPRLPDEAVEGAVDRERQARGPNNSIPQTQPQVERRLAGGKSLVAVGRGGPRLLERLPTRSPTPVARAPIRSAAKERTARRPAFPGLSVVVLAVLAAAVWSLAAWNDNLRLARQQRPERLAARPASTQPASP